MIFIIPIPNNGYPKMLRVPSFSPASSGLTTTLVAFFPGEVFIVVFLAI
jgi:hypothetical protein